MENEILHKAYKNIQSSFLAVEIDFFPVLSKQTIVILRDWLRVTLANMPQFTSSSQHLQSHSSLGMLSA